MYDDYTDDLPSEKQLENWREANEYTNEGEEHDSMEPCKGCGTPTYWGELSEGGYCLNCPDPAYSEDDEPEGTLWYCCPACKTGLAPVDGIEQHRGLIVVCACGCRFGYGVLAAGILIGDPGGDPAAWYVYVRTETGQELRPVDMVTLQLIDTPPEQPSEPDAEEQLEQRRLAYQDNTAISNMDPNDRAYLEDWPRSRDDYEPAPEPPIQHFVCVRCGYETDPEVERCPRCDCE